MLGLAATLGVKAYSVTQSVVVMILATVAVALGLMAFNCTMSVVCNIKTITVAIVVTQIYGRNQHPADRRAQARSTLI